MPASVAQPPSAPFGPFRGQAVGVDGQPSSLQTGAGPATNVPAAMHYAVAVAIGVSVALAVGVAAFVLWRSMRAPEPSVLAPAPTVTAVDVPAHGPPVVPTVPSPSAVPPGAGVPSATSRVEPPSAVIGTTPTPSDHVAPAPSGAGTGASAPVPPATGEVAPSDDAIVLTIPDGATVFVAGAALADGAHTVPRPKAGQTLNVIVRAAGYDDAFVTLNAATISPFDVQLRKRQHHRVDPSIPANPY
jgi:hypothetical protein